MKIHDAGENSGLVEHRTEFGGFRNVTIDLEDGFIAQHLHSAVDNDLAAILAGMAELAGPVMLIAQIRAQFSKFAWEFCLQERVAAAPYRFVRRIPVKPVRAAIPELDRTMQAPHKHRLIGQREQTGQALSARSLRRLAFKRYVDFRLHSGTSSQRNAQRCWLPYMILNDSRPLFYSAN
jgi:hypothetical protein